MTDTDDLLSKADALLAKSRARGVVSGPPSDYPLLTEVVDTRNADDRAPAPEIPAEPEITVIDSAATASDNDVPVLDSPDLAELEASPASPSASAEITPLAPTEDFPQLPALDPASDPASREIRSIEERIRSRVLEAIEPRIQAYLDDSLRHRLEDLMRETATRVAAETRVDIMSLIRDAVRTAVVQEIDSRQDTRPGGR